MGKFLVNEMHKAPWLLLDGFPDMKQICIQIADMAFVFLGTYVKENGSSADERFVIILERRWIERL